MQNLKNIFLIDDDEASNFLSKRVIAEMKISDKTQTFLNGQDALEFMLKSCKNDYENNYNCPELILLDINMPVMDGFQFLHELENNDMLPKEKMKIFILTSSEKSSDLEKAKHFNIDGYISKPITKKKLESILA